jgi:hypothetical protein
MHSEEYLEELKKLHSKKTFGLGKTIPKFLKKLLAETNIKSMLDFGCGKGMPFTERNSSDFKVYNYDPVTSPIELPTSVDLVYSSDVLEHIEPIELDNVLTQLFTIGQKYQYHLIACHPAKKSLSDGRNAHLIIETPDWWRTKIQNDNWKIIHEDILDYEAVVKKGPPIHCIKYIVCMEKV